MIFITDMNKTDKENLKLIEYRLDEQDKRVDLLHQEFDSKLGDIHTDIKFIKEIYSIPKLVYGQKPNKTQHLERILQCGEVLLVVV